jgi:hypothetical protein
MTDAAVAQAAAIIQQFVDNLRRLEASVDNLEQVERARMQKLQLAAWNHAGIKSNAHGRAHQ